MGERLRGQSGKEATANPKLVRREVWMRKRNLVKGSASTCERERWHDLLMDWRWDVRAKSEGRHWGLGRCHLLRWGKLGGGSERPAQECYSSHKCHRPTRHPSRVLRRSVCVSLE